MMPDKMECGSCRYWVLAGGPAANAQGVCHRVPPTPIFTGILDKLGRPCPLTFYPATGPRDWCGELAALPVKLDS